ncbi:MAG: hypothetical protein AAF366_14200 [Pseudomonadota bacterium]
MSDRRPIFGLAVLALTGCAVVEPTPPSPYTLVPAVGGLQVAGSGREIGFGRDRDGAVASAASVTGAAPEPVPCAGGRQGVRVDASLTMIFTGRTFTGWETEDGAAGTPCA